MLAPARSASSGLSGRAEPVVCRAERAHPGQTLDSRSRKPSDIPAARSGTSSHPQCPRVRGTQRAFPTNPFCHTRHDAGPRGDCSLISGRSSAIRCTSSHRPTCSSTGRAAVNAGRGQVGLRMPARRGIRDRPSARIETLSLGPESGRPSPRNRQCARSRYGQQAGGHPLARTRLRGRDASTVQTESESSVVRGLDAVGMLRLTRRADLGGCERATSGGRDAERLWRPQRSEHTRVHSGFDRAERGGVLGR